MHQEKDDQQWEEALKQHFQTCPQCGQVWLVFGLLENEEYTCQTCRHCFSILRAYCTDAAPLQRQKRH
jgi:Zn-finger nucleic acid-binding protein